MSMPTWDKFLLRRPMNTLIHPNQKHLPQVTAKPIWVHTCLPLQNVAEREVIYEKDLQDTFLAYFIFVPSELMVVLTELYY